MASQGRRFLWLTVFGAEFGHFVAVAANGHAAPLAAMTLGGVVKIKDAIHTGAPPEILQIRGSKELRDGVGDQGRNLPGRFQRDMLLMHLECSSLCFLGKHLPAEIVAQKLVDQINKIRQGRFSRDEALQIGFPQSAKSPDVLKQSLLVCRRRQISREGFPLLLGNQSGRCQPGEDVIVAIKRFERSAIGDQQGVGEVQRGVVADKKEISGADGFVFRGAFHAKSVTVKLYFDKLHIWSDGVTVNELV
jgi:hypothetical protein